MWYEIYYKINKIGFLNIKSTEIMYNNAPVQKIEATTKIRKKYVIIFNLAIDLKEIFLIDKYEVLINEKGTIF